MTVIVVRDDKIAWARLCMEPVEEGGTDIEAAVRELYRPPRDVDAAAGLCEIRAAAFFPASPHSAGVVASPEHAPVRSMVACLRAPRRMREHGEPGQLDAAVA